MKNCRIIIQTTQKDPVKVKAFAIDPNAGYLFLTKYDTNNRTSASITRYYLDGTNDVNLITKKIFYPHDMTLDLAVKKIYYLDYYFDFIQQCDYDGGNRRFLQNIPLMKFNKIAFFENMFYVGVSKITSIIQISKSHATFRKTLAENLKSNSKVLKIFHQQTQPPARSKACAADNKCEHLCIPVIDESKGTQKLVEKCVCKEGYKYDNGRCTLKDSRKFIMFVQDYGKSKTLRAIETETAAMEQTISPIFGLKSNVAFDVDLNNRIIYFSSYSDSSTL
jgi:hypothetical protein